ncbi:transposase [Sporosarcina sp. FSL K6-1522]|uniref:transposase n=1 Tax=Sporosarcina sp. FSL K6-1522 TaxID=2921554 RepID=UPI00315AEE38
MKVALIVGSILLPLIMIYILHRYRRICTLYNILMVLSVILFGDIAALSILQIIQDNTVFMTAIHAIFLDPLFLATGAYIWIYTIYCLMLLTIKDWSKDDKDK